MKSIDFRFNRPCHVVTKAKLRGEGFFHYIEPAPIAPSRRLKIEPKTKVDASGDFDTFYNKIEIAAVGFRRDDGDGQVT